MLISKQKIGRVEGIELVRMKREQHSQDLCFNARPFVLCGLPVRRLPKEQLLYERRNGDFVLQVTGHPEFGVPFGQDRLVPIFLATLAVRQKTQVIRFRSAAEMLETFGMHKGGKEYRPLIAAFERIFGTTIAHPVPNDLDAVKVLAACPAVLDLYMWLSYRCFKCRGSESIPIFGPCGLKGNLGWSNTHGRDDSEPCWRCGSEVSD